jgi:phage gp45-like
MSYCVVCGRDHVLLCCLWEGSCLIVLFVGGPMSYCVVCVRHEPSYKQHNKT